MNRNISLRYSKYFVANQGCFPLFRRIVLDRKNGDWLISPCDRSLCQRCMLCARARVYVYADCIRNISIARGIDRILSATSYNDK